MSESTDYLIVGAGIIGLALAKELKARCPKAKIAVVEKEGDVGQHASGRNSGVLHSGIFYGEDSVKVKVCSSGAKEWAAYCQENHLPITKAGKVILPTQKGDEERIEVLYDRGKKHGIAIEILDNQSLKKVEPEAYSISGKALYLPEVSIVEPIQVVKYLSQSLEKQGVQILRNHPFEGVSENGQSVRVAGKTFSYGHLFNAAGLHADRVAHAFDVGKDYTMLPFKGIYYEVNPSAGLKVNGLIYAAPDPRVPFLGIHYSKKMSGEIYLGPTVVPAFGRENYHGLSGLNVIESVKIMGELFTLYLKNHQGFRMFVHREGFRMLKPYFYDAARKLTPALKLQHLLPSHKVGIRAQLLDWKKKLLVMDFLVEQGEKSTHILNAVSPAFTSAFPFARLVLDQVGISGA